MHLFVMSDLHMQITHKIGYNECPNIYIIFTADTLKCCGKYGFIKSLVKRHKSKCVKSKGI